MPTYARRRRRLARTLTLSAGLTVSGAVDAFEFKGYIRSEQAWSNGHSPACFHLPGAPAKYRYGNECQTYSELLGSQERADFGGGTTLTGTAMVGLNDGPSRVPTFTPHHGDMRLPQAYLRLNNVAALGNGRLWAGRQYYRRNDIHINDFFYWNPSGLGAGLENADLGLGGPQLSYAWFRSDGHHQRDYANRHDMQLSGMATNPGGELQAGVSFIQRAGQVAGSHAGWSVTLHHLQTGVVGGKNRAALQYGQGPGIGLGHTGTLTAGHDTRRWRVLDAWDWQSGNFGGQIGVVHQRDIAPAAEGGGQRWWSFGIRPVYAVAEHLKFVLELGHDRVTPDGGPTRHLTKVTVAPVLSMGRTFWSRPELRFFHTYARWNQAAQAAAAPGNPLSTTGVFGSALAGHTIGLHFETWW